MFFFWVKWTISAHDEQQQKKNAPNTPGNACHADHHTRNPGKKNLANALAGVSQIEAASSSIAANEELKKESHQLL